MTVINPSYGPKVMNKGIEVTTLSYSYSGLYSVVDPKKYNKKSIIDEIDNRNWNNLY
jgi:hypothetical protein